MGKESRRQLDPSRRHHRRSVAAVYHKAGRIWGHGFTRKVIWAIVKAGAKCCGLPSVAPHNLRRTCARLCHQAGGELEQIQFLLGHISIQTTEVPRVQAAFSRCG
ncbi:MAG TPA: tyrosine-type recombinase/integrase [Candidatus Polarisedimenticolia bacterium]|nr:tyrosine-type recombinase/integrase [Candidatus Polarisedimenticolia bacterium]